MKSKITNRPKKKPGRKKRIPKQLPTIWRVPDALWERVEELINEFHPAAVTGRPRGDLRRVVNGIIYQLRTGCQWNQLPHEFGSDTTVHRWLCTWIDSGLIQALWSRLASECDELGEVNWEWQSADGAMGKSRMGGGKTGPNPTDRRKPGTKKSVLVDEQGGPLAAVIAGANVNDFKRYPSAVASWRSNWPNLSTFYAFPEEVRRMIYTTNAVEALHRQFRKLTKTKGAFPTDDPLKKMLYLATLDLKGAFRGKQGWPGILGQLKIVFGDRVSNAVNS